jgi:hypothetical protein
LLGGVAIGRGLRLNNPYRLSTQLGESGESLSLSATYSDVWAAALFGDPDGFRQGAAAHLEIATVGIAQEVLAPSWAAVLPLSAAVLLSGRIGPAIVLEPDFNAGGEAAVGAAWLFRSGVAVHAEGVYAIHYGAATHDVSATVVPIVALQIGVLASYEVLP